MQTAGTVIPRWAGGGAVLLQIIICKLLFSQVVLLLSEKNNCVCTYKWALC